MARKGKEDNKDLESLKENIDNRINVLVDELESTEKKLAALSQKIESVNDIPENLKVQLTRMTGDLSCIPGMQKKIEEMKSIYVENEEGTRILHDHSEKIISLYSSTEKNTKRLEELEKDVKKKQEQAKEELSVNYRELAKECKGLEKAIEILDEGNLHKIENCAERLRDLEKRPAEFETKLKDAFRSIERTNSNLNTNIETGSEKMKKFLYELDSKFVESVKSLTETLFEVKKVTGETEMLSKQLEKRLALLEFKLSKEKVE